MLSDFWNWITGNSERARAGKDLGNYLESRRTPTNIDHMINKYPKGMYEDPFSPSDWRRT